MPTRLATIVPGNSTRGSDHFNIYSTGLFGYMKLSVRYGELKFTGQRTSRISPPGTTLHFPLPRPETICQPQKESPSAGLISRV